MTGQTRWTIDEILHHHSSTPAGLYPLRKHRLGFTHLIASPVVHASAPSARSLAAPSNVSYNSKADLRAQEPIFISFPSGWRAGPIHEWYTHQPTTKFLHLEYRKDLTGTFRHEFIVARLDNGTCCRFDRRAKHDLRVHAVKDEGTIAEDTAHVLHHSQGAFATIEYESELVLSITFPDGKDILLVLAIFFSLQSNLKSQKYTLTRFNCYFVCWTVVLIAARCTTDWSTASRQWDMVTQFTLSALTSYDKTHRASHPKNSLEGLARLRQEGFSPKCERRLCKHEPATCLPLGKALKSELSSIKNAVESSIQKSLLQSRARSAVQETIRAAVANAMLEVAGKHALYVRTHMRLSRRRYLNLGELFTTRVYEPGELAAAEKALKMAATAAIKTLRVTSDRSAVGDWRKQWDEQWKEAWPTEGKIQRTFVRDPDNTHWRRQVELDSDSSAFLQRRHQLGWLKEFKLMTHLGEPLRLTLTDVATSRLFDFVSDLDLARLTIGKASIPIHKSSKDAHDTIGARAANKPMACFQDIINQRIEAHCLMVQNSGFGFLAEVRDDVEIVMTEIWIATRDILKI